MPLDGYSAFRYNMDCVKLLFIDFVCSCHKPYHAMLMFMATCET